jgi:uroporphyrinogen-III decarboxylase
VWDDGSTFQTNHYQTDYTATYYVTATDAHGCISTAGPVAYGTEQETINSVRETLEIMKPGGGYAFAPTHELQDNSPVENVVAMY